MENNELRHHGILGMKWGQRRFQNKDGTLTRAGQKRYSKEMAKMKEEEKILRNQKATKAQLDKLAAKRKALDAKKAELEGDEEKKTSTDKGKNSEVKTEKTAKEMSIAELSDAITKLRLEKTLRDLQAQEVADLNPETVSKGREFINSFKDEAIKPAVKEAGKALIKDGLIKLGKKALGLDEKEVVDSMEALKKESTRMTYMKNIAEAQDVLNKHAKAQQEAQKKNDAKSDDKPKSSDSKSKADKKTKADQKSDNKKSTEEKPKSESKSEPKSEFKSEPKDDTPRAKATVEKDTRSAKEKWDASSSPIYDVEFSTTPVSEARSSSAYSIGQNYVTLLLEDYSRR